MKDEEINIVEGNIKWLTPKYYYNQTEDGQIRIDVQLVGETVWLTIEQMSQLFYKSRSTINKHIINIYNERELEKIADAKAIPICNSHGLTHEPKIAKEFVLPPLTERQNE